MKEQLKDRDLAEKDQHIPKCSLTIEWERRKYLRQ